MTVLQGILGVATILGSAALIAGTLMTKHTEVRALGNVSTQKCNRNAVGMANEKQLRRAIAVVSGVTSVVLIAAAIV